MLFFRPSVQIQRGSEINPVFYDTPATAPIINLLPYEHLDVRYIFRHHIFLIPHQSRPEDALALIRHFRGYGATRFITLELEQNDWEEEGFREGDKIAAVLLFDVTKGNSAKIRLYGHINHIKGNVATINLINNDQPTGWFFRRGYLFAFVLDIERRNRPLGQRPKFISLIRRQGDITGDVSPLSGLLYGEPHADGIRIISDSYIREAPPAGAPHPIYEIPLSGISDTDNFTDIAFTMINYLNSWSAIPASEKSVGHIRIAERLIRIANFFPYRAEYNTLARFAQRDLYHENADLTTKYVINADDRELTNTLRLRLLHANVFENGASAIPPISVPTIGQGAGIITSTLPVPPSPYTVLSAHFALTTDNNDHHLSTRIQDQHDLTRFTNATLFSSGGNITATTLASNLLNDLRRNPFETYIVAIWKVRNNSTNEEFAICSDTLAVDIDEGISQIMSWYNDSSLDYPYSRFDTFLVGFSENGVVEKGEYNIYIRARLNANSNPVTIQNYTMKVDESTRKQTPSLYTEEYYTLHYGHKSGIIGTNLYTPQDFDFAIQAGSPNQALMMIPAPSFDLPTVRSPRIRPASGNLFDWFTALGATPITIGSGSLVNSNPVDVADAEVRIYVFTPSGKLYATPWRLVRARKPTDLVFNNHWITINETATFVIVSFPTIGNEPATIKASAKLFNDDISTLKPLAEANFDNVPPNFASDPNKLFPLIGFFGSRLFIVNKQNLPQGRYKLHVFADYRDSNPPPFTDVGYFAYSDDIDYTFVIGNPPQDQVGLPKQECCYEPPVIVGEQVRYIVFNPANKTYSQQSIVIPANPVGSAWNNFRAAYECCFKIYNGNEILEKGFVDVIANFNNRVNNIPIVGDHFFRYRGFIKDEGYEITNESYTRSDLSEEPVIRTFRKRYTLELFLSDCDKKALDFQKLARTWTIRNYTNSAINREIVAIVQNIEVSPLFNKVKATVTLIEQKPDEYRHI